jgi:Group II intron, maturase-specific domain
LDLLSYGLASPVSACGGLSPTAGRAGRRCGEHAKIRQQTERCRLRVELAELVQGLNRVIRGWRTYFRVGNSTKKLADLDRYVRLRLWIFLIP